MTPTRQELMISTQISSELAVTPSLLEQRETLRQKIQAQRRILDRQLGPAPETERYYPRSMIMRFFHQRPGLAITLLGKLSTLLVGVRIFKSTGTAMALAGLVQSAFAKNR